MPFVIRPYHASDLYMLYRICLLTGASGQDASQIYRDHELLGHLYAAPYGLFEPETCFTLTHEGHPCGYILATPNSTSFAERCEQAWFPVLRERYPLPAADDTSPDAGIIRSIHRGFSHSPELSDYPAHLHIDLLPIAQGQGNGRRMIHTLLEKLRTFNAPGVHLGVGKRNTGAVAFYRRVGLTMLQESDGGIVFGQRL
jgi:GNAT superfamily N-acetyltransferase